MQVVSEPGRGSAALSGAARVALLTVGVPFSLCLSLPTSEAKEVELALSVRS